ncbi:hypothetical protein TPY_0026 [Sulfobacillus acidophilus TPY]|nr:hypothetical protein TPY_0026 [Sulfobacillus acidophilus TPY]
MGTGFLLGQDQLNRLGFKFPIIMIGHRIFTSIEQHCTIVSQFEVSTN